MRIAFAEVIPYALPFRSPYVTARGRLLRREMALLRLRSDEGLEGLGEAVPLSLRGGASLSQVVRELEQLAAAELDEAAVRAAAPRLSAPARCAALTALMDLRGRITAAAGGEEAAADSPGIPCNATLVAGPPAEVAEEALRWAEEGFAFFKLKLGAGDDVAQVEAVRAALGPQARIRVDVNGAWDLETARRRLAALEPLDVELAEQPVASVEEMAELAGSTRIPLAADESVASRADAERAAGLGACEWSAVKLSKVGGPEEAIAIAEVLPCYLSSALDGPVGIAAAAQVAQTLLAASPPGSRQMAHGLATQRLFASTVAKVECELRGGRLFPPPGPGLGVQIDEAALAAHRI